MKHRLSVGLYLISFPRVSETFVVDRILGLLDSGIDIHIFTAQSSTDWDYFATLQPYKKALRGRIHTAPPPRPLHRLLTEGIVRLLITALRHPRAFVRFVAHCWRHRHENPRGFLVALYTRINFVGISLDVLHIEFDTQAYAIADLKAYLGCKLILGSWMPIEETSLLRQFPDAVPFLYRNADAYHFGSDYLLCKALGQGFNPATIHYTIQPSVDADRFTPPDQPTISDGILRVITVARLSPHKGYEHNLAAIAAILAAGVNVTYTVLGDGPHRTIIEAEAQHLGLIKAGIVRFCGAVSHDAVVNALAHSDVMLHLATSEGFGICTLEAQAMCVPVVASKVGGLCEAVEDGVTGFLVAPTDVDAAVEKLILLAHDLTLRSRMGLAGRTRIIEHFNQGRRIAKYVAFYETVAEMDSM
jgi:colanic acid/amylovoran biosynthesis glycosyltransferase